MSEIPGPTPEQSEPIPQPASAAEPVVEKTQAEIDREVQDYDIAAVAAGLKAAEKLERINNDPELSGNHVDIDQLKATIELGKKSSTVLIQRHIGLIKSVASKYDMPGRQAGLEFEDLVQEGSIGLLKATRHWDPEDRRAKFSTYARIWIRQGIIRAVADQSETSRMPAHISQQVSRVRKLREELVHETGEEPTIEKLSQELGIPPKQTEQYLYWTQHPRSQRLEHSWGAKLGEGEYIDIEGETRKRADRAEFLVDPNQLAVEDEAIARVIGENLYGILEHSDLSDRERFVLEMRFGFDSPSGAMHTLEEVGKRFGVQRERIRQIESKALAKLRHPLRSREYKGLVIEETDYEADKRLRELQAKKQRAIEAAAARGWHLASPDMRNQVTSDRLGRVPVSELMPEEREALLVLVGALHKVGESLESLGKIVDGPHQVFFLDKLQLAMREIDPADLENQLAEAELRPDQLPSLARARVLFPSAGRRSRYQWRWDSDTETQLANIRRNTNPVILASILGSLADLSGQYDYRQVGAYLHDAAETAKAEREAREAAENSKS